MIGRLALLAALAVALVSGQAYKPDYKTEITADKDFLLKQKRVYEILYHFTQPEIKPELYKEGMEFKIDYTGYTSKEAVSEFLHRLEHGYLGHDAIFTIYHPRCIEESRAVFKLFFYAKDFDTFYKTALFCRNKLNHNLFVYSFYLAVFFRPDTKYIRLPPLYEMIPHFFFNNELFEKAHHAKAFGKFEQKHSAGYDTYIIPYNYSNYYLDYEYDYETRLNYYTEDIGLNNFYFFVRNQFPFFLSNEEIGFPKSWRGAEFFYAHKQIFTRYYLERLSNDLGKIEDFDWDRPFYPGYWPTLHHPNGLPFPSRKGESYFPSYKYHFIHECEEYETRISQAIDAGIIYSKDGKYAKIYTPEGLNILGNMVEGNADTVNDQYYGSIHMLMRNILGFNIPPMTSEKLQPSALEYDSTSMRDPAFWRMTKRILHHYYKYKINQKPYKPEEIQYPEFKIESVEVDKLLTYFDYFDATISNGLAVESEAEAEKYLIQARQYRLNHKPFNINFVINSEKATKGAIRIFLGPKYNVHMKEIDFFEHFYEFYEMDNFLYDFTAGANKITRNCHDFFYVGHDYEPSEIFYKKISKAIEGVEEFKYQKRIIGFPDRLILPKGKPEGMPFQLFIFVSPALSEPMLYSSRLFGDTLLDNRALGYPLDRRIERFDFHGSNFFFKDILIYHKQEHDQYIMF